MRFGLNLGDAPNDLSATQQLDVYLRQVEAGQAAGFSDFFVGHHYAYPSARWLQPLPLLARLSAELGPTSRIGTGILVAPLFSPVALAEEVAALAAMAPGRFVLGVGTGYRRVEYDAVGVDWEDRQDRLAASVTTMRRLWAGDDVVVGGRQIPSGCRLDPELRPRMVSGAKSVTGARLAGRLGLGLLGASKQSAARLETVVAAHRDAWAGPGGVPPMLLMRNLSLGATRAEAADRLRALAGSRMQGYQREGLLLGRKSPFGESDDLADTALLGPPDRIREEVAALSERTGTESVLLRAQWPGMEPAEVVRWLHDVGRAVIHDAAPSTPAEVATHQPRRTP